MNPLVEQTLKVARKQLGVQEEPLGSNWGPQVSQYLLRAGYSRPDFWCAAFVYWCADEARRILLGPDAATPFCRTGYCPAIEDWAERHNLLTMAPEAGDVFLLRGWRADERRYRAYHTGFVLSVTDGAVATIEGNTNDDGSNNGIGVFTRTRSRKQSLLYVAWSRLLDTEAEALPWSLKIGTVTLPWALPSRAGRALCPVRKWGEHLGFKVGWDDTNQAVTFNGQVVPVSLTRIDGTAYAPVRDLAAAAGLTLSTEPASRRVFVSR
jgi:hypothetical protein